MFADYRVPQSLRHVGIISYSDQLAQLIDSETELQYSGKEEVELRAVTIIVVDMILQRIKEIGSEAL